MEGDQLKLLEERIGKAIDFIEKLKSREKVHVQDKEDLQERVDSLEKEMQEKNDTIAELKESQVFLKEKIETILGKLESWADMVDVGGYELDTVPEPESSEGTPQSEDSYEDTEEESDDEASSDDETSSDDGASVEEIDTALGDISLETEEDEDEDPDKTLFDTGEEDESSDPETNSSGLESRWPDSGFLNE